jgi:hypothetical protein
VLDLPGVTWRGRLVVIAPKASEDIQLPIQALDYWLRVRRHQRDGDFEGFGYFSGVKLDPQPPLVWLVAPGLRFHSATDTLLKYLAPELQMTHIGLIEDWRRVLKIVFRQYIWILLRQKRREAVWIEPAPLPGVCPRSDLIV